MSRSIAIRWHSRAGQGAITVANALAEFLGRAGKYVQSFPEYGAEKRGAPVLVFNRISNSPIVAVGKPTGVDCVVLLDSSLIASHELTPGEVLAGLHVDGKLLVNTSQAALTFAREVANVYTLDASTIAVECIGKNIPNVPILGALVAIAELGDEEGVKKELEEYLASSLPPALVAGNLAAFTRGYQEVKKVST